MYRRRARILFLSPEGDPAGEAACALAVERGSEWIEARAGLPTDAPLAWADLVISLRAEPAQPLPGPHKHWPLPQETGAMRAELGRRIEGLLGGMRLLARSDGSAAPGA